MAKHVLVFPSIFLLAWVSTLGFTLPNGTGIKGNVVYLGSVDGKSFFSQITPKMTWLEAQGNCTESGMQLASVTSVGQRTLLNQAFSNNTYLGTFWTSGRDALAATQMVWDTSGYTLNTTVVTPYGSNSGRISCLAFHSISNISYHFDAELCTHEWGAICEINHGE